MVHHETVVVDVSPECACCRPAFTWVHEYIQKPVKWLIEVPVPACRCKTKTDDVQAAVSDRAKAAEAKNPKHMKMMDIVVDMVVLFNTGLVLVQEAGADSDVLRTLSSICLWTYVGEMALKIIGMGPKGYWRVPMNRLEGIITLLSVVFEAFVSGSGSVLSVIRIIRLVRMVRNVIRSKQLRIIFAVAFKVLGGSSRGLLGMLWVVFYIYAVLGMMLFGGQLGTDQVCVHDLCVMYVFE